MLKDKQKVQNKEIFGRKIEKKTSYKQEFKIGVSLMRKAVFQIRIWEEERIFRKEAA